MSSSPAPALAIVNARVRTGDPRRPWADAVIVRGDRIELVGSSAEAKKRADASSTVIDAKGMTVTATGAGVLRAGSRADLVLLDREPMHLDAVTAGDPAIALQIAGGRVLVDRDGLIPTHTP